MRWLSVLALLLPAVGMANDWDALRSPGAVAIMRHALAPGTGDPEGFVLGDCATQRNLDARGQAQARKIGQEMRDRGIGFDVVLTSQWCRARETAELLKVGPVAEATPLNSFYEDRASRDAQTEATRALIAQTEGRVMMVTHQVNISALTGQGAASGEVLVIVPQGAGFAVLGRILIAP